MSYLNQQGDFSPPQSGSRKSSSGFTLIELLVVVAIIGALAAIALPMYRNYVDKAKVTVSISTLDSIRKNFESFHIDYQQYPAKPINLTSGLDAGNRSVFSNMLLEQINDDLTNVIYNTATDGYILTANAKDNKQTALTLTPTAISKAP